jgi:hypothetical protein
MIVVKSKITNSSAMNATQEELVGSERHVRRASQTRDNHSFQVDVANDNLTTTINFPEKTTTIWSNKSKYAYL